MLHWWLIPLMVLTWLIIWVFYLLIRNQGEKGVRKEGRTLVDEPEEDVPGQSD